MSHNIKHISIPQPCTQNWADMDVTEQGRFCQSCHKTVVDFTFLNAGQILDVLSSATKVCGRFEDIQLKDLNAITAIQSASSRFSWKRIGLAAAAFVGLVPFIKVQAKTQPPMEHRPALSKKPATLPSDTVKQLRTITGSVKDSLGAALNGATIIVAGTPYNAVADINGNFRLSIPDSHDLIVRVSYIGFTRGEFKISQQIDQYSFVLKESLMKMGEVVIDPVKKPVQKKSDKH